MAFIMFLESTRIVEKYKEDIMVLSGNLYGEIPGKILNLGENQAESFGMVETTIWSRFFISKSCYNQEDENRVNKTLIEFAQKTRG
jgi:DNA polymerase-3 subunit alpha